MTVKAIFSECSMPLWLDVAERLTQEHSWEPCYWIALPDFEQPVKKKFPNVVFHSTLDAIRGIDAPDCTNLKFPPLDQPLLEDLSFCESIALQMMNRMDPGGIFGYEERVRLYHHHVRYWTAVLNHFNPDVVISPVAPHVVYDYVLYELCKKENIRSMMFMQTTLVPLIYPVNNFESESNSLSSLYKSMLKSRNNDVKAVTLSEHAEEYLSKISQDYSSAIPFYMASHKEQQFIGRYITKKVLQEPHYISHIRLQFSRGRYIKQKGKKIEDSDVRGWKYLLYVFEGTRKKNRLKRYYNKLMQEADFDCPYIYVPLHYQPERSTSPEGGVFANQLLMVELLSTCAPEGWSIYVKENPVQFQAVTATGECSRTIDFYDDLAALPNVTIVPISTSSFELIDNSMAVATVTGTAGWEAVLRGKPTLIFGHAWYKGCEGVFYTPTKDMCRYALSKIQAGYIVDNKLVRLFVHALEQVSVRGYVGPAHEKVAGISHEENVAALTDAIHDFFTRGFPD